jgi:hypothetical protein
MAGHSSRHQAFPHQYGLPPVADIKARQAKTTLPPSFLQLVAAVNVRCPLAFLATESDSYALASGKQDPLHGRDASPSSLCCVVTAPTVSPVSNERCKCRQACKYLDRYSTLQHGTLYALRRWPSWLVATHAGCSRRLPSTLGHPWSLSGLQTLLALSGTPQRKRQRRTLLKHCFVMLSPDDPM